MIIINSSIPKSGSSFRFDIERSLIKQRFGSKGQIKIERHIKDGFAEAFSFKIILIMLWVNFFYGSFAIKTHSGPNKYLKLLLFFRLIKVTFSVRYPGDVALSAMDHAKREKGYSQTGFKKFVDFDISLPLVKRYFNLFWRWQKFPVLILRHEDFVSNLSKGISEINNYLNLGLDEKSLKEVRELFEKNKEKHYNFNKGIIYRTFSDLSNQEIERVEHFFIDEIKNIGYPLYINFSKLGDA